MTIAQSIRERRYQIACILGMACVWPSVHNQLLYPITFSFHKEGADDPYFYYLIYCAIMLLSTILISFGRQGRIARRILADGRITASFGMLGALGTSFLIICDFSHDAAQGLMGVGAVFSAVYVPIYFIFWSTRIVYASEKRAGFDLVLSYLAFCLITLLRLALKLHAWPFAICYPFLSALLALFVCRTPPQKSYALSRTSFTVLPLMVLIPMVLFVYIATIMRCLMNPLSATYDYPPSQRVMVYIVTGTLALLLALLYRPHARMRRYAHVPAFVLAVVILIGGILWTGVSATYGTGIGNLPTIAGVNALQLIIWVFVLANAQAKHSSILRSSAIYLIFVIGATHLITVLYIMGVHAFSLDQDELPMLIISIAAAFLIILAVNAVLTALLYKAQSSKAPPHPFSPQGGSVSSKGGAEAPAANPGQRADRSPDEGDAAIEPTAPIGMPPCMSIAADDAALTKVQEHFHLSKRETETLRYAYQNLSAKEIAECMFVAQSTVNSHLKGIYRKCDVHSKQELRALVNRYKKDGA